MWLSLQNRSCWNLKGREARTALGLLQFNIHQVTHFHYISNAGLSQTKNGIDKYSGGTLLPNHCNIKFRKPCIGSLSSPRSVARTKHTSGGIYLAPPEVYNLLQYDIYCSYEKPWATLTGVKNNGTAETERKILPKTMYFAFVHLNYEKKLFTWPWLFFKLSVWLQLWGEGSQVEMARNVLK